MTLDFNGRMAFTKLKGLNGGADTNESNAANSAVANSVKWNPVEALVSVDDDSENSSNTRRNPVERISDTYKYQERFSQNYNVGLNWKPFKNITFRTEFGYAGNIMIQTRFGVQEPLQTLNMDITDSRRLCL